MLRMNERFVKNFEKATLGEGLASCDKCGAVVEVDKIFTLYDVRGDYLHVCYRCLLDPDGRSKL